MKNELNYKKESVYKKSNKIEKAFEYAEGYKTFLNNAKTEREAVKAAIDILTPYGFREYKFGDKIATGDKLYYNNRGKNLFVFTIGTESLANGLRMLPKVSMAAVSNSRLLLLWVIRFKRRSRSAFRRLGETSAKITADTHFFTLPYC